MEKFSSNKIVDTKSYTGIENWKSYKVINCEVNTKDMWTISQVSNMVQAQVAKLCSFGILKKEQILDGLHD